MWKTTLILQTFFKEKHPLGRYQNVSILDFTVAKDDGSDDDDDVMMEVIVTTGAIRMMEVIVTTGAISRAKLQSNHH